jgi:hypothetical protein
LIDNASSKRVDAKREANHSMDLAFITRESTWNQKTIMGNESWISLTESFENTTSATYPPRMFIKSNNFGRAPDASKPTTREHWSFAILHFAILSR